jgi:hypothetical protein
VLTPSQRAALADKVSAHLTVWLAANTDRGGGAAVEETQLDELSAELGLTEKQVSRTKAALAERMKGVPPIDEAAIAATVGAFAGAFRTEAFDARTLAAARPLGAPLEEWGVVHLARLVEAMSDELTGEQRDSLARKLRTHAAHLSTAQERS